MANADPTHGIPIDVYLNRRCHLCKRLAVATLAGGGWHCTTGPSAALTVLSWNQPYGLDRRPRNVVGVEHKLMVAAVGNGEKPDGVRGELLILTGTANRPL